MKKIFLRRSGKILASKDKIEKALNVKLEINPDEILIEGSAIDEHTASKILEALELGFDIKTALLLIDEEVMLEKIYIKDYVRASRVNTAKARVIGKEGKVKRVLSGLTECAISVKDHTIALIGKDEDVENALLAITSLIRGKHHSKEYASLERFRSEQKFEDKEDLGLKMRFIKKKLSKGKK